ncbi:uncharacterized protein LOC129299432 [Prosopis cineraria]|uniref:uncharacterized protein LOC129299432 n=1 Tax=Prosopis cineraria TaxID=364024 RepID=UPI00240EA222|nr:uncharacterized protein LOC129299432 [Prosopis cineraria]
MGCCFSNPKCPKQDHPDHQNGSHVHQPRPRSPEKKSNATHEIDNQAPPGLPPTVVEETVKVVLSETTISKPQVSILVEERSTQMAVIQPRVEKFEKVDEVSEVSQTSEICSLNESFSTTTTTTPIAEKREDEATRKRLNQPPFCNLTRKRSCSVDSSDGRERRSKSPARRSEPSPEKKRRQGATRSVRGRESGQVATRKPNVGPRRVCRDGGEASDRRSKSPPTRPVSAASGRSQVKPPAKAVENSESDRVGEENDDVSREPQESLDNPLVSLECFIFL